MLRTPLPVPSARRSSGRLAHDRRVERTGETRSEVATTIRWPVFLARARKATAAHWCGPRRGEVRDIGRLPLRIGTAASAACWERRSLAARPSAAPGDLLRDFTLPIRVRISFTLPMTAQFPFRDLLGEALGDFVQRLLSIASRSGRQCLLRADALRNWGRNPLRREISASGTHRPWWSERVEIAGVPA